MLSFAIIILSTNNIIKSVPLELHQHCIGIIFLAHAGVFNPAGLYP